MKYLLFNLSGPLQAWGGSLPGMLRTINDHPTKSAIVGLLGACLGIDRREGDKLTELGNQISIACRIDAPGRKISDLHIVKNHHLRYTTEQPKKEPQNILSLRDYLCNAVFTICVSGRNIDKLYNALRKPVYVPFLGRKSCLPNGFFPRVIMAKNLSQALRTYNIAEIHKELIPVLSKDTMLKVFWEGPDKSISPVREMWKHDQPNGNHKFRQRRELMGYMERVA